ncbi:MAG TPA: DMT family transporter [Mesorhizobium sp.]|nr:DMT family transporter [Mesorhizobium sp.]
MIFAAASYVVNDTLMKLATEGLPPYEVLFLRGVSAVLWGFPILFALGHARRIPLMLDRAVLLRNGLELLAILSFILALANMGIADAMALGQVTPLLVLLGASALFGERLGWRRLTLVGLGFCGAILVAQPSSNGISVYAVLALLNAGFCAARDLASRRVGPEIPGMVVAFGASAVVLAGAGLAHLLLEDWVVPSARHVALLGAAGLFLFAGHLCIFMAYRIGPAGAVAPFYYFFSFWAVLSGVLVFGHLPNGLALAGIALIIGSGVAVVMLDQRQRRLAPAA